ncbi:MAG: hypothetical protein HYU69_00640 [Bacteroidetes bacterium]|nr:hypothetical protein [Bacteroidota bacterium]
MKKGLVVLSVLLILLTPTLTSTLFAQPPGPPGGTTSPACWPPPCVPIDGGISFLIVAGIGLGVKKAYGSRKRI